MATTAAADLPPNPEALVAAAQAALQAGRLAEAEREACAALALAPEDREALYALAAIQRYAGQAGDALATIDQLLALHPAWGRAHQERGHILRSLGRDADACTAYAGATEANRGLLAAWRMLATYHAAAGRGEAAAHARAQAAYLASLPPELQSVISLIAENKLLKAERLVRGFLASHKHHPEAMRLLAEVGTRFSAMDEAEFLLESVLVLEPANTNAHLDYVNLLRKRQKLPEALAQARALVAKAPGNPQFDLLYATQTLAVGNFAEALSIYEAQLAKTPRHPGLHLTHGHALKTVGRQDEAIAAYRRCCELRPAVNNGVWGEAFWSLANLKTYRFTDAELAQMADAESAPDTPLADRYHLAFALGKALEDREDYAASFGHYERGNRLKLEETGYDWRMMQRDLALQAEHCTGELFARFTGAGCPADDPIFILGLPRAGSTLIEQILASHSKIEGTMELPNILALAHRLDGRRRVGEEPRYPANLGELAPDELRGFGEAFIADTRVQRRARKRYFIDKMPNNFRHIGLIHLILPNARIIDARRGAEGCCFSGFKQLFAEGQEFTYGLEPMGHYYRDYVGLMAHWDAVLPGKVLRVRYEDVVADVEGQARRMLDFLGLPFEAACVRFHETARAVRTASSEQVRQPIFTGGLDQWRHYAPWLGPLRKILGPDLVD